MTTIYLLKKYVPNIYKDKHCIGKLEIANMLTSLEPQYSIRPEQNYKDFYHNYLTKFYLKQQHHKYIS